jgi:hypothetical protein
VEEFSQLLNVRRVSDVWQVEVYTAEKFLPDPTSNPFEGEIGIAIQAKGEPLK